jgi:adenylate cyclase class IV
MSLGYEIGTIMRRTSTLIQNEARDVTVKFDDVEHLGNFIQVGALRNAA